MISLSNAVISSGAKRYFKLPKTIIRSHNPKVGGSNPSPATKWKRLSGQTWEAFLCCMYDPGCENFI